MADSPISYRKIRGTSAGAFEYTTLYAGPDHLLQVTSTGYRESYRRFYFREIQSITVRKSGAGKVLNGIWGGAIFMCCVLALQAGNGAEWAWIFPVLLFLLLLIVNLLRGPTCECQIRTAVQTRKLSSLKRLRQTRKFIAQFRPQIEAAQEAMSAAEIARRLEQIRQGGFYTVLQTPEVTPSPTVAPGAAGGLA